MLDCMYVEAMENMQRLPDYAKMFRGKPLRFVLPLNSNQKQSNSGSSKSSFNLLPRLKTMKKAPEQNNKLRKCDIEDTVHTKLNVDCENDNSANGSDSNKNMGNNLIKMVGYNAEAYLLDDLNVFCVPESLCDLGCETPRINYDTKLGNHFVFSNCVLCGVE